MIFVDDTDTALQDAAKRYLHDAYSFEARMRCDPLEKRFNGKVWQAFRADENHRKNCQADYFASTKIEEHSG